MLCCDVTQSLAIPVSAHAVHDDSLIAPRFVVIGRCRPVIYTAASSEQDITSRTVRGFHQSRQITH